MRKWPKPKALPRRLEFTNKQSTRIDCDISVCSEVMEGPEKRAAVEYFMRVDTLGVHLLNTGPVEVIEVVVLFLIRCQWSKHGWIRSDLLWPMLTQTFLTTNGARKDGSAVYLHFDDLKISRNGYHKWGSLKARCAFGYKSFR